MKNILLVTLFLAFTANLTAQALIGSVIDEIGAPVADARVTIFNNDTTIFYEARTDANGGFYFNNLETITYKYGIAKAGKEYVERNLTVNPNTTYVGKDTLAPETEPGNWEIIMQSPEALGGTDLGVLMPDGSIYYCHNTKDPFYFLPTENDTSFAKGSMFAQGCVAPALLLNGHVLFAGGTLEEDGYGPATKKVKIFDPISELWQYQPDMLDARWYPSLAPLYDERLLIVGGGDLNTSLPNAMRTKTSEVFDPATGISVATDTVHFGNEVSPILPLFTGKILMTHRPPQLFDPETMQWELAADFVQGNRLPNGDHSDHELVHLPDGKVLAVGYKSFTPGQPGVNLEMYDPLNDEWTLRSNLAPTRSRAKAVLLPDKKVLVMGGQKEDLNDPTPVNNWGYMDLTDQYDPATDVWRRLEKMNIKREYHAITALVPDGRIIAVGGEGAPGNEPPQSMIEAFSPPYLFRGVRPEISNLNTTEFQRGGKVQFNVAKTNALTDVVLMSNGVLTHFMNSGNNRYLDLDFIQTGNSVTASLPTDSLQLMPGWYMLFGMVDDIPSVAKMVKIEKGLAPVSATTLESMSFPGVVYPNPTSGFFSVEMNLPQAGVLVFDLKNTEGRSLRSFDFGKKTAGQHQFVCDAAGLPGGFYFLETKLSGELVSVQKLVIE